MVGFQMQSSPSSNTKTPRPAKKTTASSIHSTTPGCATYAFITHSPDTLPHNLPPDVDNNALARRRRRRTSQHDQAILEAEYAKNERPDKAARRDITRKVGLGEKEVQIWFQNRRQTNRRKAKPLLPHEMVPKPLRHDSSMLSSDPILSSEPDTREHELSISHTSNEMIKAEPESTSPMTSSFDTLMSDDHLIKDEALTTSTEANKPYNATHRRTSPLHMLLNPAPEPSSSVSLETTMSCSQEFVSTNVIEPNADGEAPIRRVPALLKRSSSMARLSMSLEGKASVILEDEPTSPSPSSQPSNSQCSSFSEGQSSSQPKRRTVNAKVWEVCCDSRQSSAPPSGSENTTQDTPRKTIKLIRARKLVADAKAAAEKRRRRAARKGANTGEGKESLEPNSGNVLAPKSGNKLTAKLKKVVKSSPKVIDKNRKTPRKEHSTPTKSKNQHSMIAAATPGPLYLKTPESLPRNNSQTGHESPESDKENLDPEGKARVNVDNLAATKAAGDAILKDLNVGAGEIECIENLLSLRGGVWG